LLDLDLSVALLNSKEDPNINDRYALKSVRREAQGEPGGVLSEQSLSKAAASQGLSEVETRPKAAARK